MRKNLLFIALCLFITTIAQTTHTVNAGAYYYSPNVLNINQGDVVIWINDGGYHDVNGDINSITNESFNNPEVFDSPSTSTPGAVIYEHLFNIPGIYNYDCSVGSHAINGMTGQIIVNPTPTTVVDIISNSANHTTLEAAVMAADLDDSLSGDGPFTVFAPTDDAFNALPEGIVEALLVDPTGDLANILLHHVYSGSALSTDLSNGMTIPTLLGTELTVSIFENSVMIDNAMVTIANIMADNGVVHVINAVLLPVSGCTDEAACNYNADAIEDDGSCEYSLVEYYDCNGYCINDIDGDSICDELEILGCTNLIALNYNPEATEGDESCEFEEAVVLATAGCIWSDDFAEPSNWVIDHDDQACSLDWEIGLNLGAGGYYPIDTIQSLTYANGVAMVDSDEYGGDQGGSEVEDSWITIADPIDLSQYTNVQIQFETFYRSYNYEKCWLVVSTDGVTWPDLTPDSSEDPVNGIYEIFPDISGDVGAATDNPTTRSINISESAGGQSQVWIRFHWTGTWGYSWFVDDVCISEVPANDVALESMSVFPTGTFTQYGRVPQGVIDDLAVGNWENTVFNLSVTNLGFETQDFIYTAMYTSPCSNIDVNYSYQELFPGQSYENQVELLVDACIGMHQGSIELSNDDNNNNNFLSTNFEVTENEGGLYSVDGIGVYDSPSFSRLGTGSFTDATDGLQLMNYYYTTPNTPIWGVQVLLDSYMYDNYLTQSGGEMVVRILDTSNQINNPFAWVSSNEPFTDDFIFYEDFQQYFDYNNFLYETDFYQITNEDVINGFVNIPFEEPLQIDSSTGFYVAVELYSNNNNTPIYILDDTTVEDPTGNSSMIYIPGDQQYSNGNALAIRLMMGEEEPPPSISGCIDELACNYNASATNDDGTCWYSDNSDDCILGCTEEWACNYNPDATDNDGTCEEANNCGLCSASIISLTNPYAPDGFYQNGNIEFDLSEYAGTYLDFEISFSYMSNYTNTDCYSLEQTYLSLNNLYFNDQYILPFINYDNVVLYAADNLVQDGWDEFSDFNEINDYCEWEVDAYGGMDGFGLPYSFLSFYESTETQNNNINGQISFEPSSCDELQIFMDAIGVDTVTVTVPFTLDVPLDSDNSYMLSFNYDFQTSLGNMCGSYVPNEGAVDFSINSVNCTPYILGCMDSAACNYTDLANFDNGSCIYVDGFCETCSSDGLSVVDNDSDNDGVCDADEIIGCQNEIACNYDINSTDAGDCDYSCLYGCMNLQACNYDSYVIYEDGSCEFEECGVYEVFGCIDEEACNYDFYANTNDGTCGVEDDCGACRIPFCFDFTSYQPLFIPEYECSEYDGLWFSNNCDENEFCVSAPINPFWNSDCDPELTSVFPNTAVADTSLVVTISGNYIDFSQFSEFYFVQWSTTSEGSQWSNTAIYQWSNTSFGQWSNTVFSSFLFDNFGDQFPDFYSLTDWFSGSFLGGESFEEGDADIYIPDNQTPGLYDLFAEDVENNEWVYLADAFEVFPAPTVLGCTDDEACNFNPSANLDDGSCGLEDLCGICHEPFCFDPFLFEAIYIDYNDCNYIWVSGDCFNDLWCLNDQVINPVWNDCSLEDNEEDESDLEDIVDSVNINFPWLEPSIITDCNATLALTPESMITIDDEPITEGDWIGLFYTDLNNELVCGGSGVWTGEPISIAIWGDDVTTDDIKEGFIDGEELIWMIYDNETDQIMTNVNVNYQLGSEFFACNALLSVESISAYLTISQQIILPEGWFIMSTYVSPEDSNMNSIFQTIEDNISIVKSYSGNVYWPFFDINSIGSIVDGQGYYIKMNSADTLNIEGDQIPNDFIINMPEGWFITSYLHQSPASAEEMFSNIIDDVSIVKSYDGNVYWPLFNINSLGNMQPGWGYYIKNNNSVNFSYPDIVSGRYSFDDDKFHSRFYQQPINTGNNMTIAIPEDLWLEKPSIGDEIVVYNQEGLIVGNNQYSDIASVVTLWGDDELTIERDGLLVGEEFFIKLHRSEESVVEDVIVNTWDEGAGFYSVNGISIAGSILPITHVPKKLIKITDLIGREVNKNTNRAALLYIYDDGTVEKKYRMK